MAPRHVNASFLIWWSCELIEHSRWCEGMRVGQLEILLTAVLGLEEAVRQYKFSGETVSRWLISLLTFVVGNKASLRVISFWVYWMTISEPQ